MPNTPSTRPISLSELDIVRDIALQIWPKVYRAHVAPDQIDSLLSSLFDIERMEDEMDAGHRTFLMRVGRVDVGFVTAYSEGNRIWINKLAVLPDFRGFGLARQMIKTVQDAFAPADDLVICVHKDHIDAVEFLRRSGFAVACEIPSPVEMSGLVDYVMRKPLREGQLAA